MRGIAILLVIFNHCQGGVVKNPVATTILAFHMPLFFFITGLCLSNSRKAEYGKVAGMFSKNGLMVRKLRTLLVPQITLGLLGVATVFLFDVCLSHIRTMADIDFKEPFTQWFLIVLFLVETAMALIVKATRTVTGHTCFMAAFLVLFLACSWNGVEYLQQFLCGTFFCLAGYVMKAPIDRYASLPARYRGWGWMAFLLVTLLSTYNEPVGMYVNQYGSKVLFMTTAIVGIAAATDISLSLRDDTYLQWIGRNTIIVFVLHFTLVRVSEGITSRLLPEGTDIHGTGFIITFLLVVAACSAAIPVCNRYLPWMFGKKVGHRQG